MTEQLAERVAGIVLFGFATKTTLAHVGDELGTIPALALCGGPALYLFAYVRLRVRVTRTLGCGRLVAAIACALLVPVGPRRAGARGVPCGRQAPLPEGLPHKRDGLARFISSSPHARGVGR